VIRTRIKICGITRQEDLETAVLHGADAIGFNAYDKSARYVGPEQAARLARGLPPFVTAVALFVNPTRDDVAAYLDAYPGYVLQFHGDEAAHDCEQFGNPYLKAARIGADGRVAGLALADYAQTHPQAQALLLDAHIEGYGGGGKAFNWSQLPPNVNAHLVLSGGLTPANVADGIRSLRGRGRSLAVDVSSGVESAKGIKDAELIRDFVRAVRSTQA